MSSLASNNPLQDTHDFTDLVVEVATTRLGSETLLLPLGSGILALLSQAAQAASDRGWLLYLVGGVVRDLILFAQESETPQTNSQTNSQGTPKFTDIDLVVDGGAGNDSVSQIDHEQNFLAGAGIELAQAIHRLHPQAKLEIHEDFHTAALRWQNDSVLGSLSVDLATTRTETYPYPAANPQVKIGSIHQDLYRRDFTINALALKLTGEMGRDESLTVPIPIGETLARKDARSLPSLELKEVLILDFFGGWQDLLDKQIRVLHANSFIDDPTRIYRAVRFAVRLGFTIEPQTQEYIHTSIAQRAYQQYYDQMLTPQIKFPALQNRLKTEIKYLFQSSSYQKNLQLLGKLEALKCLHPQMELTNKLWQQVRLGDRLLKLWHHFLDHHKPPHIPSPPDWLLRLELIIAILPGSDRPQVANNLQLPVDSISRLQQLALVESNIALDLPDLPSEVANVAVSQVVERLKYYNCSLLLLTAIRSSPRQRRQIWQYLTIDRWVRSPLDGNALKNLGYPPGKEYKLILEALTTATLDGFINSYESAMVFLANNFPLPR